MKIPLTLDNNIKLAEGDVVGFVPEGVGHRPLTQGEEAARGWGLADKDVAKVVHRIRLGPEDIRGACSGGHKDEHIVGTVGDDGSDVVWLSCWEVK